MDHSGVSSRSAGAGMCRKRRERRGTNVSRRIGTEDDMRVEESIEIDRPLEAGVCPHR
jgi:hypothetical protein